ncbi:MAG: ATP-binding protein [Cellvibrionales bacterium]|nr:ATP-binding protein [Cellvibrionales bacterium]
MIKKITLRNFKSIGEQVYELGSFDLLVGRNNSGKSTVLQALAIWQYCVDEFSRTKRTGSKGIQVLLPNFTALPVPEFSLLWKNRTIRKNPFDPESGKRRQDYILIDILLEWQDHRGATDRFGVHLRYHSPQTIYAIPADGWERFREYTKKEALPRIAYVPPFSGLEPAEKRLDEPPMRQQVGKGQPGSVLRNLLLRVSGDAGESDWNELAGIVERWFGVKIKPPEYDANKDVFITVEYIQNKKRYDIISGGSGFHQTLTLLAFLFGYRPTTILLDEPDAHLHVNLQREVVDYFSRKSQERGTQFLIATHAEEFVRGVNAGQIISLLDHVPKRVSSTPSVLHAMAEVSNEEIVRLVGSPYIVYVEGESDERILRAWATTCDAQETIRQLCFKVMGGGGKQSMKDRAERHYAALQQIIPTVKRLMLFDFDDDRRAFHREPSNPVLFEWKRKNIENYLLVSNAWKRVALSKLNVSEDDLFAQDALDIIDGFFGGENLTLPEGQNWENLSANIFSVVDGKRLLFEDENSLFCQLEKHDSVLKINREDVATAMKLGELSEDIHSFMGKLKAMTE